MAANKKDTPVGYDRWDTFTGTIIVTSKLTETQKKAITQAKKEQAEATKEKKSRCQIPGGKG